MLAGESDDGVELEGESDDGVEEEPQDVAPTEERAHVKVRVRGVAEARASAAARAVEVPAPPPKVAKLVSAGNLPTLATVVQSPRMATVVQARPATAAQAAALPQPQWGSGTGTPSAPILVSSATPRQSQQEQGGGLLQAMAPSQAGVPAMGMLQGQPWGAWPVMMQAGPGGQPGTVVVQWMPTAAISTPRREVGVDGGGLPVRVVCRGCGLVRFDVEGRRWVHNHRQGKGNKQFVCNRVLCGCQKGQICPTKGQPHDPVAPGAANAAGMGGQLFSQTPVQPGTSSLPPILNSTGTPSTVLAAVLAGAAVSTAIAASSSSGSGSLQPSGGQAQAAPLAVAQVPSATVAEVAPAPAPVADVAPATVEAPAAAEAPAPPVAVVESAADPQ